MTIAPGDPTIFAVSAALDGVIATLALWFNVRTKQAFIAKSTPPQDLAPTARAFRTLSLPGVLSAVILTGLFFAFKMIPLMMMAANFFGLIHLVYLDLFVVVPVLGLLVLIARCTRLLSPTRAVTALSALSLLLIPVGLFTTFIEPFRLQTERAAIELSQQRAGQQPFTIAVLADLQTDSITDHEQSAFDLLMAHKPDLILIPGDLFQGTHAQFETQLPALRELLARLHAPGGVYFVMGDVDGDDEIRQAIEGTQIQILHNELAEVRIADRRITIGGIGLRYDSPEAARTIHRLEDQPGSDDVRILLAHRPDAIFEMRESSRIDMLICGHTHGGQIQLPLIGPPIIASEVPRRVGAGGLHELNGNTIYVSRGIGWERSQAPRIRFLCPPEISLLTVGP